MDHDLRTTEQTSATADTAPGADARGVLTSAATVPTARGERWVRQLASHLGHKAEVREEDGRSVLHLSDASCVMSWDEDEIALAASGHDTAALERVQRVVGGHLERFSASSEGLRVVWV